MGWGGVEGTGGGGQRNTQSVTDRKTDKETETETDRDRETHRETETVTERERQTQEEEACLFVRFVRLICVKHSSILQMHRLITKRNVDHGEI